MRAPFLLLPIVACHPPIAPHRPNDTGTPGQRCSATGGRVIAWGAGGVHVSDEAGETFTRLSEQAPQGVAAGGGVVVTWSGFDAVAWDPARGAPVAEATFPCSVHAWLQHAMLVEGRLLGICTDDFVGEILRAEPDGSVTPMGVWATAFQPDQGALYLLADQGRDGALLAPVDPAGLTRGEEVWADEARGPINFRSWGEVGNDAHGSFGWAPWTGDAAPTTVDLPDGEFVNGLDLLPEGLALVDVITWPGAARSARLLDAAGTAAGTLEACSQPRLVCRDGGHVETWCASPLARTTWTVTEAGWEAGDTVSFPDLDVQALRVLEDGD